MKDVDLLKTNGIDVDSAIELLGDIEMYQNKYVLTFKGKEILTKIIPKGENGEEYTSTILDSDFAIYLLKKILTVINYRYKNEFPSIERRFRQYF